MSRRDSRDEHLDDLRRYGRDPDPWGRDDFVSDGFRGVVPLHPALADRLEVEDAWGQVDAASPPTSGMLDEAQRDRLRCHGEGEVEVGTRRDEFGNWDTETYKCRGCPDCLPCPLCGGTGDGDYHPGANVPEPCPACHGRGRGVEDARADAERDG